MTSSASNNTMSLKRSADIRPGNISEGAPKLARSDTVVLEEPPAVRRPQLDCHIVVLSQQFAIEERMTEKHGFLRGLGNTFTLEVIAEGCEDAVECVGKMLNIDFETDERICVVRVVKAPKVHWTGADGRNVSVLSSRYTAVRDGATPYEELINVAKGERSGNGKCVEGLQRRVNTAMAEAERARCCESDGE